MKLAAYRHYGRIFMVSLFCSGLLCSIPGVSGQLKGLAGRPKKAKNIIFLIGDGMGTAQIYAGLTANHGLNLERFKVIGFSKTNSSDKYITDSAAGATAFSIGKKTFNGAIGVDATGIRRDELAVIIPGPRIKLDHAGRDARELHLFGGAGEPLRLLRIFRVDRMNVDAGTVPLLAVTLLRGAAADFVTDRGRAFVGKSDLFILIVDPDGGIILLLRRSGTGE